MTKSEFLIQLERALAACPKQEAQERINFYDEMINDLTEECLSEEEAVAKIGDPNEVAKKIMEDIPLSALVKERIKPDKNSSAMRKIVFWATSIIWIPLLIALAAVIFSLFVVIWSLLVSAYAVEFAFAVSAIASIVFAFAGYTYLTIWMLIGIAFFLAGAAAAGYIGCMQFTKFSVKSTRVVFIGMKNIVIKSLSRANANAESES